MSKLIEGFENYSIDRQGNIFNHITGTFKTPTSNKSGKGYIYVDLYSKGKRKRKYVHRLVADCKTSDKKWFSISRLEENQIMAFELWLKRGNTKAFIFIKYNEKIYQIPYRMLKGLQRINLEESENFVI